MEVINVKDLISSKSISVITELSSNGTDSGRREEWR